MWVKIVSGNAAGKLRDLPRVEAETAVAGGFAAWATRQDIDRLNTTAPSPANPEPPATAAGKPAAPAPAPVPAAAHAPNAAQAEAAASLPSPQGEEGPGVRPAKPAPAGKFGGKRR